MRKMLAISLSLTLLGGCRFPSEVPTQDAPFLLTRRLPPAYVPTPTPSYPLPGVLPARFEEEVPRPAATPETLPQAALQPVAAGPLTLAQLEEMAMSANPSLARVLPGPRGRS